MSNVRRRGWGRGRCSRTARRALSSTTWYRHRHCDRQHLLLPPVPSREHLPLRHQHVRLPPAQLGWPGRRRLRLRWAPAISCRRSLLAPTGVGRRAVQVALPRLLPPPTQRRVVDETRRVRV
eukprot:scaffold12252_cov93-Isochrysis_galbana.AAC.6